MGKISDYKGVVVLYNDASQLIKGNREDLIADQDVVNCAQAVSEALQAHDVPTQLAAVTGEPEQTLAEYPASDWLIFNLAEGYGGKLFEEARIAWLLEAKGYCFTGASGRALALTTNKALTKHYLSRIGLKTPTWWLYQSPDAISADVNYPFPLFVKPVAEDASLGIEYSSVVTDHQSLRERVAYLLSTYQQSVLVEEFIPGREFNIAAWGDPPELLPLAEIDFQAMGSPETRIVNFSAKWKDSSFEYHHTPAICPAEVTPRLGKAISRSALSALKCTGVTSYARVDLRLSEDGTPYLLEINCNPDISPGAGFAHAAQIAGFPFPSMVLKILSLARRPCDEYHPVRKRR